MRQDRFGNALSATDAATVAAIEDFALGLLGYDKRIVNILQAADRDRDCLANAYAALLWMLSETGGVPDAARQYLHRAEAAADAASARERAVVTVLRRWLADDLPGSVAAIEEILAAHPRDLVMLKLHQYHDFNAGDFPAMLRVALASLAAAPEIGFVHGMAAFGYEQCHLLHQPRRRVGLAEADRAGRRRRRRRAVPRRPPGLHRAHRAGGHPGRRARAGVTATHSRTDDDLDGTALVVTPDAAHVVVSDEEAIETARELAAEFAVDAAERDRDRRLPGPELDRLSASGLLAITVPARFGGAEVRVATLTEVFRLLATVDSSIAQIPHSHFVFLDALARRGTEAQQQLFFGAALAGARFANAQSERGGKTITDDATTLTARDDRTYSLDGEKFYCTGALFAHWLVVRAVLADEPPLPNGQPSKAIAFVRRDEAGVTVEDDWDAVGQRTTASGTVRLDGVVVPAGHVVPYSSIFDEATTYGSRAQVLHAALDAGLARGALDAAVGVVAKARPWFEAGVERAADDRCSSSRPASSTSPSAPPRPCCARRRPRSIAPSGPDRRMRTPPRPRSPPPPPRWRAPARPRRPGRRCSSSGAPGPQPPARISRASGATPAPTPCTTRRAGRCSTSGAGCSTARPRHATACSDRTTTDPELLLLRGATTPRSSNNSHVKVKGHTTP